MSHIDIRSSHRWHMEMQASSVASSSVHVTISRLRELLVCDHFVLETNEDFFHVVIGFPLLEDLELGSLDLAVCLVNTGQVDLGSEANFRRLAGIVGAAFNGQEVNAVVKVGVGRPDDSAVPVCEGSVIT